MKISVSGLKVVLLLFSVVGLMVSPWRATAQNVSLSLNYHDLFEAGPARSPSQLSYLLAQEQQEEDPDVPLMEEEEPTPIGWFVGPMFMIMNYDSSIFNPMTVDRGLSSFSDGTFVYGLMGGLIRENFRFGALFLTGGHSRVGKVQGDIRYARMDFFGGGLFFEYNREFKTRIDLEYPARIPYFREGYLIGLMAGTGRLTLAAEGDDLGPNEEWRVEEGLYIIYPYVGVWSSPYYEWLWIQLDMGYLYFSLDTEPERFTNAGVQMIERDFTGGFQIGLKITVGDNPNI